MATHEPGQIEVATSHFVATAVALSLQLRISELSESMGNHDSEVMDVWSLDRSDA
jgi:hypothetical protein